VLLTETIRAAGLGSSGPTFERGFGFHPLCAFVDHGAAGTGEMVAVTLSPGNAGSNTALDHIAVTRAALAQLPAHRTGRRPGKGVLIRTDGAGSSHAFLDWLTGQRLPYSVGFALPNNTGERVGLMQEQVWTPAYNSGGAVREGAWVAELTGMLNLAGWPKGCGSSPARSAPTPGRSCGSPTLTGCGSPCYAA